MAKKIIQDIIVNKDPKGMKTSVCVVSQIKETASKKIEEDRPIWISQKKRGEDVFSTSFSAISERSDKISNKSRKTLWAIAAIFVVVVVLILFSSLSTAEISIYPNEKTFELSGSYNISNDPNSSALPFEIVQVEKTLSKPIEPDSEEQDSIKATGKAFIYNEYSTSKQRLVINTRLQTLDGLIYKIKQSVDVPGYKMEGNKKIPGMIEVEIIADDAGEQYNMKMTDLKGDFTIPGLKDYPEKYKAFYGRLSSDIAGGFIGLVKKVSEEKKEIYKKELRDTLTIDLIKEFSSNIPKSYVFFEDIKFISFDDSISGKVSLENTISEKGTLKVLVFNENKLASTLIQDKDENFGNGGIYPVFTSAIKAEVKGKTEQPWLENNLVLNLEGQVKIVKQIDEAKVKDFIKGMRKSTVGVLIKSQFPEEVNKISINLRPQWNLSMPKKAENIKVRVILE